MKDKKFYEGVKRCGNCVICLFRQYLSLANGRSDFSSESPTSWFRIDYSSIFSKFTSHWEVGSQPHKGTRKILEQQGISYQGMRATQIQPSDFKKYDYIIGMDANNVADLKALAPQEEQRRIHLFMEVVVGKETMDVPDPYYTGDFEETYRLVEAVPQNG